MLAFRRSMRLVLTLLWQHEIVHCAAESGSGDPAPT
jgi:hypothetical protein